MSDTPSKRCVICGHDCAGQPRIKNDKGQYAHKACVAKRSQSQSEPQPVPEPEPLALDDDQGLAMDDLLGDLDTSAAPQSGVQPCPECGHAMAPEAVVCMACGHNAKTGKKLSSKVLKAKPDRAAPNPVPSFATGPTVTMVAGAAIAAALGAGIWAGIIIGVEAELRFIALIVGAMVGIGAAYGARGNAGVLSGGVAVLFAIAAILVGRYIGVSSIIDTEISRVSAEMRDDFEEFTEDEQVRLAKQVIADDLIEQRIDAGESLDPELDLELLEWGYYPDDYPDEIITRTESAWDDLTPSAQAVELRRVSSLADSLSEEERTAIHEGAFLSVFGFRDVLFFTGAIVAAFMLGGSDQVSPFSS